MMIKRFFSAINKKVPIQITDLAWNKINDIVKNSNSKGMVLFASSGGCNGFNYNLKLLENYSDDLTDSKMKPTLLENNDCKVYIDPLSEMFLLGTKIDYVNEDYSKGVYESKFLFEPDKELATSCGCGVSFSPK